MLLPGWRRRQLAEASLFKSDSKSVTIEDKLIPKGERIPFTIKWRTKRSIYDLQRKKNFLIVYYCFENTKDEECVLTTNKNIKSYK